MQLPSAWDRLFFHLYSTGLVDERGCSQQSIKKEEEQQVEEGVSSAQTQEEQVIDQMHFSTELDVDFRFEGLNPAFLHQNTGALLRQFEMTKKTQQQLFQKKNFSSSLSDVKA
jgi:hypothetical protein